MLLPTDMPRPGVVPILMAAVLWGSIGIAGRFAFRAGVGPLEAAFYRAAISFLVLFLVLGLTNRRALEIRLTDFPLFAGFGLVSIALFFVIYLIAIDRTSVATAAILLYTAPAFVIVLSTLLFDEPLTRGKVVAIALTFTGCVLVVRGSDPRTLRVNLPGTLAGLGAGFTYAMYTIFGKTALRRYRPVTTLTYALGFGTIFLGIAALTSGGLPASHPPAGWAALAYLALVTTLLAQWLYLVGLHSVDAGRASLMATLEPVIAAVLGYLVLGEHLEAGQLVGGALVLAAVAYSSRSASLSHG